MAIDFLNRIFGVQPVKKDFALTPQKRRDKRQKKEDGQDGGDKDRQEENKEGKIDIKV